ncbi:MAG: GDP-mannose 4,6-dehydratase [Candidatus Eremiobacteraeota bacterium]|nr:GDP-mannose 4,6-dehydratase [Candidatus Eremiobacteraeota bacterium]
MRALVTGANGFVGRYLCEALRAARHDVFEAAGPDCSDSQHSFDLGDPASVRAILKAADADVVFHLAAQTFVPDAIRSPQATYEANVIGTARLLEGVRELRDTTKKNPRVMFASSAEVYGPHPPADFPLKESAALHPANPYAASKAAAEAIVLAEAQTYELDAIVTRAFNHIGPGQSDRFVVASFAAQLAGVVKGNASFLSVGNLSAQRDFLDVRDVVAAYVSLIEGGKSGEVYNVSSGTAVAISEVLRRLITVAHAAVEVREDPERMRPSDVPYFYGDSSKLRDATGWLPGIALDASLRDIYAAAVN